MGTAKKITIPVILGNTFSWFDFALYAYFAPVLSKVFFHTSKHSVNLLLYFAVFAIGFFFRPIGGSVWGYIADQYGRKFALLSTVVIMTLSTALIGALPTYAQAGVLSPMLLTILRIVQTVGISGEPSNSSTYMVESSPQGKRGFTGSLVMTGIFLGFFIGILSVTLVTSNLRTEQIYTWGWRIPFLASIVLGFLVFIFLRTAAESPIFLHYKEQANKAEELSFIARFLKYKKSIFMALGATIMMAVANYTYIGFMSEVIKHGNLHSLTFTNIALCLGMFVAVLLIPFMGHLSDKVGRRPIMMLGAFGFVLLIWPILALAHSESGSHIILAMILYGIILSAVASMVPTVTTELFPTSVRASGSAVGYSLALSIFGGTTPFLETALYGTGNVILPSLYIILIAIIHLIFIFKLKETYKEKL